MPHVFLKLSAPRPTHAIDVDAQERAMMAEHFACWKSSRDAGEVILFEPGARSQGTCGAGVIAAADEAAARAFSPVPIRRSNPIAGTTNA